MASDKLHEIPFECFRIDLKSKIFFSLLQIFQNEIVMSFEPNSHMTRKTFDKNEFADLWRDAENRAEEAGFTGYMEGEHIQYDNLVDEKPFTPLPISFQITRRRLTETERFRETEIHISMDADKSDPRLIQHLLKSGLYGAYMNREDRRKLILTAQGYCHDIAELSDRLGRYLGATGGVVRGTLKEERIVKHRLFGVKTSELPEIVDSINIENTKFTLPQFPLGFRYLV